MTEKIVLAQTNSELTFEKRQQVIESLVNSLKETLAYNVRNELIRAPQKKAADMMKNALIGLFMILILIPMRTLIGSLLKGSGGEADPGSENVIKMIDTMMNFMTFIGMTLAVFMIGAAALAFLLGQTKGTYAWRGKSERKAKFDKVRAALSGIVDESREKELATMLDNSYQMVESLDTRPEMRSQAAEYFTGLFGQTLVSANVAHEIKLYGDSRWTSDRTSAALSDLNNKQNELVNSLAQGQNELNSHVDVAVKQTSKIRDDVKKLALTSDGQTKLAELLSQAQAETKLLAETSSSYSKKLLLLQNPS